MLCLVKDLDDDDYMVLSTTDDIVDYILKDDEGDIWHFVSQLSAVLCYIPHKNVTHVPYNEWTINTCLNL